MIETINSSGSGENNQTNRMSSTFRMPKNIRQVGKSGSIRKIYVEDYVMTFVKQFSGEDYAKYKLAVLVGQNVIQDNCRHIFIYGAIEVENPAEEQEIQFTNDTWTKIYENIKTYFTNGEIVGWFLGAPGYLLEEKEKIQKVHIDNFAGQDKVLLTYDNIEKEESFLLYESNRLARQEGYYIYYEKNDEMQTYMIDHKKPGSGEEAFEDRATKEVRTVIQNKKAVPEESKSITRLMYAAGTLLAVIVLVVAAAMLDGYDQMKNMESTINTLADNLQEVETIFSQLGKVTPTTAPLPNADRNAEANNTSTDDGRVDVEVISGNVDRVNDNSPQDTDGNSGTENEGQDVVNTPTPTPVSKDVDASREVKYYTVQSGDTLAGISLKLYNSADYIATIIELNDIVNENLIYEGQRLIVP